MNILPLLLIAIAMLASLAVYLYCRDQKQRKMSRDLRNWWRDDMRHDSGYQDDDDDY